MISQNLAERQGTPLAVSRNSKVASLNPESSRLRVSQAEIRAVQQTTRENRPRALCAAVAPRLRCNPLMVCKFSSVGVTIQALRGTQEETTWLTKAAAPAEAARCGFLQALA